MSQSEGLTFILPVADQESNLASVMASWVATLEALVRPYEVLIVDDGSRDGTAAQAEMLASQNPRIRLLRHPDRRGYGACLQTALAAATQPLIFYTSADHAWNPADLPRLLKNLNLKDEYTGKSVEIVNGHRRGTVWPKWRRIGHSIYRGLMRIVFGYWPEPLKGYLGPSEHRFRRRCRLVFGIRVGDINSKFKLLRRSVLERMELQSWSEFIHAEILAKANFLGCLMDEVVLSDREIPKPIPNVSREFWTVFHHPKFRPAGTAPRSEPHAEDSAAIPAG